MQPNEAWKNHADAVERCRGAACFGALAAHFGTESAIALEARIDGRSTHLEKRGGRARSGIYRRWERDGVCPTNATAKRILATSDGAVDLVYWRDLVLWRLLSPLPQLMSSQSLARLAPEIRSIILKGDHEDALREGQFHSLRVPTDRTLELGEIRSLDAFHGLLLLAREAELISYDEVDLLPAKTAFEILPDVLARHAALRYQWEVLFECIERVLCRRLRPDGPCLLNIGSHTRRVLNRALRVADQTFRGRNRRNGGGQD